VLQEGEQRSVEELVIDINYAGPTSRDFEDIQTRLASHVRASGYISLHACTFVEVQDAWDLFNTFSGQIHNACVAHSLAQARDAMLMEQELLVGTIVAKSSQPRKRKDVMAKVCPPAFGHSTNVC
jgi:RNA-dependent RNA polymerase